MSYIFKPLLKTFFPNATLLVDHFHVIKMINDQLNNTRKRIQRKYAKNKHSVEYRFLKHRYKLLLTSGDKIDGEIFRYDSILECHITMNGVLEKLIQIDDDLYKAYQAKEEYLLFDSINQNEINQHNLEKELKSIIKKFRCSGVEESIEVAKMLERWSSEILHSFILINNRRISNGPIEGKNNYIKKIISNANGLSNFKRARNKIMYSQNKYEKYSIK